jgi:hypothetical protein
MALVQDKQWDFADAITIETPKYEGLKRVFVQHLNYGGWKPEAAGWTEISDIVKVKDIRFPPVRIHPL